MTLSMTHDACPETYKTEQGGCLFCPMYTGLSLPNETIGKDAINFVKNGDCEAAIGTEWYKEPWNEDNPSTIAAWRPSCRGLEGVQGTNAIEVSGVVHQDIWYHNSSAYVNERVFHLRGKVNTRNFRLKYTVGIKYYDRRGNELPPTDTHASYLYTEKSTEYAQSMRWRAHMPSRMA